MSDPTPAATLAEIVRETDLGTQRPDGTPRAHYIRLLREADSQILAIIDEVNALTDLALLHALYDVPGVTLVCICVDEDSLFSAPDINSETRSRLRTFRTMHLDPYSHDELVDILDYRVEYGLMRDRVADDAIDYIADLAVGNARTAIALLRRAAEAASADECPITSGLVDDVQEEALADVRDRHIRSLGTHQRAIFEIIREAGSSGIRATDLHGRYASRVQEPRGQSMRRRYLNSLERYGLIEQAGTGRGTRYCVLQIEEA
ncbi:orc1/cdc6 family replication initiation protein [Salinibaculum marinum]